MFESNGYNLSDIAAVTRDNNCNGMFGGNNGWWIILLFLFVFFGGNGWGNFGRNMMNQPATQEDVRSAVDQQTLISKLDQQTYGLADSTYALNNNIMNGFHGVDNAVCTLGYQTQQGFNTLNNSLQNCCCETQRLIERGFCDTNYNLATQSCDTRHTICDSTRDIIDNQNSGVRQILDFLTQDRIATLQNENQQLRFAASQQAQNAYLVSKLSDPCPIPAYFVPNPNYCYPYNRNCGCGCDNNFFG